MRLPISAEEKLAITLRFLATGESYESLIYQFRVHRRTIGKFVPEVCKVIFNCLKSEYLRMPSSKEEWLELPKETFERWNFPNAFAAADGKHVSLLHPNNSGSEYYNYKGFYSLVMLALVDFDYKFTFSDVACQGRISDADVYNNSALSFVIENEQLNLPEPCELPIIDTAWTQDEVAEMKIPFMFVAYDAFPLIRHILKPYGQRNLDDKKRIYNYRLSRFRRVTENAFGIWACRYRIFLARINLSPDVATNADVTRYLQSSQNVR